MKLQHKETGEIRDLIINDDKFQVTNEGSCWTYNSLGALLEEWEDYEELKTFWYMTAWGDVREYSQEQFAIKQKQEIGNYFETKEEAERAVEKLKAWKRLKDTGFEFKGWKVLDHDSPRIYFNVYRKNSDDIVPFLDLLFGGEE